MRKNENDGIICVLLLLSSSGCLGSGSTTPQLPQSRIPSGLPSGLKQDGSMWNQAPNNAGRTSSWDEHSVVSGVNDKSAAMNGMYRDRSLFFIHPSQHLCVFVISKFGRRMGRTKSRRLATTAATASSTTTTAEKQATYGARYVCNTQKLNR